jgi:hypothetical protein
MQLEVTTAAEVKPVERLGGKLKLFLMPLTEDIVDLCCATEQNDGFVILASISPSYGMYRHKQIPSGMGLKRGTDYYQLATTNTDFSAAARAEKAKKEADAGAAGAK